MNDLENILNIKFPDNCNISNITNNSKKVKRLVFLDFAVKITMGASILSRHYNLELHL